jgi:penicillin-binding protein 1A
MEVPSPVYEGKIPMRAGLEQSKIGATVRLTDLTSLKRVVDTACAFGFPLQKAELLRRLGVGFEEVSMKQAVRAFSVFPLGGDLKSEPYAYVDRIVHPTGRVVYRRARATLKGTEIIDGATAWQLHSMMAGSLYRGSSKGALEGLVERPFHGAGKGGSTHDFEDCWFLGYNKRVTCGVWTGFLTNNGEPIYPGAFSRDLAMPVWQAAMNAVAPAFGGGSLAPPVNVVEVPICSLSGQRSTQFCQEYSEESSTGVVRSRSTAVNEYFRRGTEKLPFCAIHSGAPADGPYTGMDALNLPALDAVPVRPNAPVLIGDDPYHTELPSFAATSEEGGFVRRRTNVLDSLDLGDVEEAILLRRPGRLQIVDE